MRRSFRAALAAAALVAASLSATPADAFQFAFDPVQDLKPVSSCPLNDGYATYSFSDDSDPAALDAVRAGFAAWNGMRNRWATSDLATVREVPLDSTNVSPRRVIVTVKDGGQYGTNRTVHPCTTMVLNTYWGIDQYLVSAATHEMGHVLGLYHTGIGDSFSGQSTDWYPAMSTCVEVYDIQSMRVRQDDRAAMQFMNGSGDVDWSGNYGVDMTANLGFENGARDWSPRSGTTLTLNSSGYNSPRSMYVHSSTGQAEMYQRVNFSPQLDVESHLVSVQARTKKHTATDTNGSASVFILERTVNYASFDPNANWLLGDCAADNYTTYRNANQRTSVGNPVQISYGTCVPTTAWTLCYTEYGYTLGSASSMYDASDLEVVVRNNSIKSSTGTYTGPDVDDLRVMHYGELVSATS
ncbi:MAG TPA: hypothetical protein VFQ85_05180 [Mycobacteriales bacterium]|jgi:hypothetical protein|nr:hypothetical protein [Mycobacteriales bacterium]